MIISCKQRIFVDCDGVLADFDKAAFKLFGMNARTYEEKFGSDLFWEQIRDEDRFYYNLDLMPGAVELMIALAEFKPWILTGSPSTVPEAHFDKQQWVRKHFGSKQPVITCQSKDKSNFCTPGDIIIDDWPKHSEAWQDKGGYWVDYTGDVDAAVAGVHAFIEKWERRYGNGI